MEKAKILIIEDEVIVAHDLADMLVQWGYDVVGMVSSGEEAVEKAQATNPNLVLADIKLEGTMDGIEASNRIRATSEAAIIYLTARTDSELFDRAKETGPYGYLTKPVAPQELLRSVEMALYKHEMEKRLRETQSRFRAIFDQTFQFIGLMNTEGVLIEANRAALDFYGLSESDVIGLPFWETPWWTHSADQQERLREAIKKAAAGEFVRFEAFHPAPDGELHYVDVSIKPVKDDQGNVSLLIPEGRDITDRKRSEEALRASEERFRRLAENAKDMIYRMSLPDGTYEYVSPASKQVLGYSPEEFYETPTLVRQIIHPDWSDYFEKEWANLLLGQMPAHYEYQIIHKSGDVRWLHQRNVIVKNDLGMPVAIEGIVTDVTDQKRSEAALRKSQTRLQEAQRAAHIGYWELDHPDGTPTWSEEIFHIFGLDPAHGEPSFADHPDIIHPEDWELLDRSIRELSADGVAFDIELRLIRQNKSIRWLHAIGYPIRNEAGEVIRLFGTAQDITDRKKAEEQLRESEERYRKVFQEGPLGMALVGRDYRFRAANSTLCEMLGYTEDELKSLTFVDITHPDHIAGDLEHVRQLHKGKIACYKTEKRYVRKDGEILWVNLTASVVRDVEGNLLYTLPMLEDITERKKAEEQLKTALKEKEVLIREIHHRVKNNLAIISSLLSMQSRAVANEGLQTMYDSAQARIRSMALAHEMLYLSENLAAINVSEYMTNLLGHLRASIPLPVPAIDLNVQIDEVSFHLDTLIPLGLILNELVSNSIKHAFANRTEGEIRVSLKPVSDDYFELIVADNGIGLPPEIEVMDRKSLGLHLVKIFVKQLEGEIEIVRKQGTEVRVWFPSDEFYEKKSKVGPGHRARFRPGAP